MTPEQKHAAALSDPHNQPLTDQDMSRMRRVPRAKIIRRALGLTQEAFAARYHIPVGTLRDWEQGRAEPDEAARAYLQVIAREPEMVRKALAPRPRKTARPAECRQLRLGRRRRAFARAKRARRQSTVVRLLSFQPCIDRRLRRILRL